MQLCGIAHGGWFLAAGVRRADIVGGQTILSAYMRMVAYMSPCWRRRGSCALPTRGIHALTVPLAMTQLDHKPHMQVSNMMIGGQYNKVISNHVLPLWTQEGRHSSWTRWHMSVQVQHSVSHSVQWTQRTPSWDIDVHGSGLHGLCYHRVVF